MSSSTVEDLAMDNNNVITDNSSSNVVAKPKQPAWNKPILTDAAAADAPDFGSVMGDFSWPALSKSAKASPKSSSDSLRGLSDGSVSAPQGSGVLSLPKLQTNNNANSHSGQNHSFSKRDKSAKRAETAQNNTGNPGQQAAFHDSRSHDARRGGAHHKNVNVDGGLRGRVGSQPRPVNNNHSRPQQSNWSRRGNYGGRQPDNQEAWSSHPRNPPRVVQRNFVGPPTISNPNPLSNTPAAVRPLAPMPLPVYHVPASMPPEPMRVMPFPPPIMPMFVVPYPPIDTHLRAQIINQIDYYFSPDNLVKDSFLRSRMDKDGGWVPISLIAGFRKVKELTENIPYILDTLHYSSVIEVKGDKIRKKNDWMKWLLIPSQGAAGDQLARRMENLGLEDGNTSDTITRSLTATSA